MGLRSFRGTVDANQVLANAFSQFQHWNIPEVQNLFQQSNRTQEQSTRHAYQTPFSWNAFQRLDSRLLKCKTGTDDEVANCR